MVTPTERSEDARRLSSISLSLFSWLAVSPMSTFAGVHMQQHICCFPLFPPALYPVLLSHTANVASVNLVVGCSKGFFFHYCNACPGVLALYL